MAAITIIAKWKAKPGAEEQLYEAFRKLVPATRAEEGCINYDLHRSLDDQGTFLFYENWTSRTLWEQHMESPHLRDFLAVKDSMVEAGEIIPCEKVDA